MNFEITELSDFSGEMAHIYSVTLEVKSRLCLNSSLMTMPNTKKNLQLSLKSYW